MENPVTPPYSNGPSNGSSSIPGEPFAPTSRVSVTGPPPPTVTPGWEPRPLPWRRRRQRPLPEAVCASGLASRGNGAHRCRRRRLRDRQQDSTSTTAAPAATATVAAQPVSTSIGSIADLVDLVRPSVVSVRQEVTQRGPPSGQAAGTGFVLSADGYIVTNNHVIAEGDSPVVTFADGTSEPATIVAGDPSRDLAVLRVDRTDLVPLAVGDSDQLRLGDDLIAVGYALDLNGEPSVTSGILSAQNRTIVAENGVQLVNLLQTDTAINPGNSGGPLLNGSGEVVGINTAIAGGAENIGFAIAITPVMDVIDALRGGSVPDRALMGVTTQPTGEGLGVEIIEIADGSGAADSSLEVGDVIVAVDDTEITDPTSLGAAIATYQPGDTITVTIERNGSSQDIAITLGTRPT